MSVAAYLYNIIQPQHFHIRCWHLTETSSHGSVEKRCFVHKAGVFSGLVIESNVLLYERIESNVLLCERIESNVLLYIRNCHSLKNADFTLIDSSIPGSAVFQCISN
jgi:hypothetical protein